MSNYLSNQIARTTETASVVQPRPLFLYEPVGRVGQTQPLHEAQASVGENLPSWPPMLQMQTFNKVQVMAGEDLPAWAGPAEPGASHPSEPPVPQVAKSTVQPVAPPEPSLPLVGRLAPVRPAVLPEEGLKPAATISVSRQPKPVSTGGTPDAKEQKHLDAPNLALRPLFIERLVARETVTPPTNTRMMPASADRSAVQPIIQPIMVPAPAGHEPATPLAGQPDQNPDASVQFIERATFVPQPHIPDLPQLENKAIISAPTNQQPNLEIASRSSALPSRPITATVVMSALPEIGPGDRRSPGAEAQTRPTIQVHIGRIEVRATPARPSAEKQQRKPPVMSLDDYLQQRNGKGTTG